MTTIPSFNSLRAKPFGNSPSLYKVAQGAPDAGAPLGQGMGGVTTGQPDEMQAPESADQKQFEQDLSNIAYQFVMDRAPALLPYMLGFEVVDRSDDGSKAVGIYGYKIDDDFYYIPVFFINNQIRGVDMILNKRTNSFVPLTEKWISYIINKHAVVLGETADPNIQGSLEHPDLTFLQAPKNQKTASAEEEPMWSLKTAWDVMKKEAERMAHNDPLLKEMFNGVLRSVKGAPFKKEAESKYIKGFMRSVGGPEAQISFYNTFKNIKFANAALTLYKDMSSFDEKDVSNAYLHKQAMFKKAAAAPKLRVVTAEDASLANSSEEEVRQVLTRGFTIKDNRTDNDVSSVKDNEYTVDFEKRFDTPTEVGKYSFVMADGKLREGYLLSKSFAINSADKDSTFVYFPKDKILAQTEAANMLIDTGSAATTKSESYKDLFDSAASIDSVEPSSSGYQSKGYLFIGPSGLSIGPFRINSVFKDGDDISFSIDSCDYDFLLTTAAHKNTPEPGSWDISDRFHDVDGYRKNPYLDSSRYSCHGPGICMSDKLLRFSSEISKPVATSSAIIIPEKWKVLKLTNVHPYTDINYNSQKSEQEINAIRERDSKLRQEYKAKYTFGTISDILNALYETGSARVKIASLSDNEFHIHVDGYKQSPRLTYKEAALTLVSNFGVRPAQAFSLLEKAATETSTRVMILPRKRLQKSAQGVGVSMPAPTDQQMSVDPYTGIPVANDPYIDQQQGQMTGVPSLPEEGGLTPGIAEGSETQRSMGSGSPEQKPSIDEEAQQLAQQAAEAGQRHVFDQAAVGGLSKVYDTSAVVDSYIPNFMDTLDRLGRVIFLFYWKHDDFTSRYGSDDVVEMEDRLRGVFRQLGDLTLKLKEKAVRVD